jgi:hypothetical protein
MRAIVTLGIWVMSCCTTWRMGGCKGEPSRPRILRTSNAKHNKQAIPMVITQFALMMAFGALVAVAGLALLYFRKEQGENRIKLFGQEFQISTPALVVFLVGCGIFILPSVIQMQNQTVFNFQWPWPTPGPKPPGPVPTNSEEHEPNDQITAANLIPIGATIKGSIATDHDRDFFKFKTGQGLKTRVILRKTSPGGFLVSVFVYNDVEQRIAADSDHASYEDGVSLVFDNNSFSYYYLMVESRDGTRGTYELLTREE